MSSANIQKAQITIPAKVGSNEGRIQMAMYGDFIYCVDSNLATSIKVRSSGGDEFPLFANSRAKLSQLNDTYEFINDTTSTVQMTIVFGVGDWIVNQFSANVSINDSTTYNYIGSFTPAAAGAQIAAANSVRNELHLKAPASNTGDILLNGTTGTTGWPLSPGETVILTSFSGAMSAAGNGTDVIQVAEVAA